MDETRRASHTKVTWSGASGDNTIRTMMRSKVMSHYRVRFRCLVLIVLACTVSSCRRSANSTGSLPDFFVVVPQATGANQSVFHGRDQIIYHVQVDYPADNVLDEINGRLKQLGWEPLKEDFLNPGLPTSQVRGWTYFVDSTKKPATSVHSWDGEWQNNSHDILNYILTYECPENLCSSSANLHDLRVVAIRIPADLAKQMQNSIPHDEGQRKGKTASRGTIAVSNEIWPAMIGKQITVHGKFALGKMGWYILLDNEQEVYFSPRRSSEWGSYEEMHGKLVTATGILKFFQCPKNPLIDKEGRVVNKEGRRIDRCSDYFYFEAETDQPQLLPD